MRDDTAFHDRIHGYAPGWDFPKLNPSEHLTDHFGLVNDFLSACWTRLRDTTRLPLLQNRVFWGGALSGRDIEAVHKTISVADQTPLPRPGDGGRGRRSRVDGASGAGVSAARKGAAEAVSEGGVPEAPTSRTRWAWTGPEQFVATPELRSDEAIDSDPLPPGQVWAIGPGVEGTGPGLYRIEVVVGPGAGGAKI